MPDTPAAPVIVADEPGTFPYGVLAERHPAILRQVAEDTPTARSSAARSTPCW